MASKEKLLTNAQKFLSKGQVSKAISEYQKLVEADPKDVRNRQKLAELLSRDKRNEDALTEYEVVAKHYTETGFYLKAIAVYKQIQKIEPSRVDVYHRLAELNEKQGLIGNALTEYRNLVSFYDKNEMHQESIEVLEKMVTLDPDNLNFSAKIAECYKAAGQNDEALEKFQVIIEPLVSKGEHVKVVKLYERFLDICPEEGTSRLPLARALISSGSPAKAIKILKGLLKHSPENPDINQSLTDAYVAASDFANARLTLKHLLKQKGDDLDLRQYYVRICIDAGEHERAKDRLEEWKDDFFQADRVVVLQGFYEELKESLSGDTAVAETLSVIYEAIGETGKLDGLESVTETAGEVAETADDVLADVAIDDVETLDMVGEEVTPDVEVPELPSDEPAEDLPAEKVAAKGVELELDLDFPGAPETDDPVVTSEDPPAGPTADEATGEADADGDVEVEIDIDGIDDLDLEIDVEADEEPEPVEAVEEQGDLEVELDLDGMDDLDLEMDVEVAEEASNEIEEIADLEVVEELEPVEVVEELEEIEELEALEEVEELESIEELDELEELDEVETLDGAKEAGTDFAASLNVDAELEEAEFYLQQGLYDDAERVVQTLLEYRPEMPELLAKLEQIAEARQGVEEETESADFVDIMADLEDDDLLAATDFLDSFGAETQEEDQLSQKTVSELDSADTESHFNLGIAYKEMGLYDDAIVEFDKAAQDPARTVDCITLTGQCHMEAGQTDAAMESFKTGLAQEGLSDEGRMTLNFELGMLFQMNGQLQEALDTFLLVSEQDSFFRDVTELIKNLRRELGLDDSDDDGGPQGNRDRVSYV